VARGSIAGSGARQGVSLSAPVFRPVAAIFRLIALLSKCAGNWGHRRRRPELFSRWQFSSTGLAALARETKTPEIF